MKINVPAIVRPIPLTNYAPEMTGPEGAIVVQCRVNPTRARLDEWLRLKAQLKAVEDRQKALEGQLKQTPVSPEDAAALGQALLEALRAVMDDVYAWYRELWSAHSDPRTHWTVEEVAALAGNKDEPRLWRWLCDRSWALINEHRDAAKKASAPR